MANRSIFAAFERFWQHVQAETAQKLVDAKLYTDEQIAAIPEQTDYTVSITSTTSGLEENIAKRYTFTQNGATIGTIDLAKELVVSSGTVKEVTVEGQPYEGAKIGDKYIELVIANQPTPIYIPVKDLVDIYTVEQNATQVQLNIDGNNQISATLVNGSVAYSHLSEEVKAKLDKEWEEVGVAQDLLTEFVEGTYNTKIQEIEDSIGTLTSELGDVPALINDARTELESYVDTEITNLDLDARFNDSAKYTDDAISAFEQEIDLNNRFLNVQNEIDAVDEALGKFIEEAEQKHGELSSDISTAEQNAKDYADSLAENYADAEHKHVVADITDFAEKVATQVEAYEYATIVAAEKAASDAQAAAEAKVTALAEGQVKTNKADIEAAIVRISNLATTSGQHTTTIGDHEGRIGALEGANTTVNNTLGTIAGQITALQGEDARLAGVIDTKANTADVYSKNAADTAIKNAVDASAELINAEVAKKLDTTTFNAEIVKKADAANVYTKDEADAAFMTQDEVDARIGTLIDAADPEGGKVISDLQKLVQYVDENAGDIEELVVAVGHNTNRLAGISNDSTVTAYVQAQIDAIVMPKGSEEVTLAEDGTLGIGQVNVNKLVQTQGDVLILDGGSAK